MRPRVIYSSDDRLELSTDCFDSLIILHNFVSSFFCFIYASFLCSFRYVAFSESFYFLTWLYVTAILGRIKRGPHKSKVRSQSPLGIACQTSLALGNTKSCCTLTWVHQSRKDYVSMLLVYLLVPNQLISHRDKDVVE